MTTPKERGLPLLAAITGAHGTGKSYILQQVRKTWFKGDPIPWGLLLTIPSSTRPVKKSLLRMGYSEEEVLERLELMCALFRESTLIQTLGTDPKGNPVRNYIPGDVLLLDRFALDELVYLTHKVRHGEGYNHNAQCQLEVLRENFTSQMGRWDWVFYKPIHPDHLPEEDGDRPVAVEYQSQIDEIYQEYINQMTTPVIRLPEDRDEAVRVVRKTLRRASLSMTGER